MGQIYGPRADTILRVTIVVGIVAAVGSVPAAWGIYHSSWFTEVGRPVEQPVPFSHEHHVNQVGIDCRYCHTSVETSDFAGIPPIKTCMTCHSQLWDESPMLEPIRESWRTGVPVQWNRVNEVPDFVFFNHSIHVTKGIGCDECHGRVDLMPLTSKEQTLRMRWCLECHTHPERYVRPRSEVFNLAWQRPENQEELGRELVARYHIDTEGMTDCVRCHR